MPLVESVLDFVKRTEVPFVVDADGLWFIKESIRDVPPLPSAIFTPNHIEFSRMCEAALDVHNVLDMKLSLFFIRSVCVL
ncbi:hypothetical protein COOONC_14186 [Cooperia oncophora]